LLFLLFSKLGHLTLALSQLWCCFVSCPWLVYRRINNALFAFIYYALLTIMREMQLMRIYLDNYFSSCIRIHRQSYEIFLNFSNGPAILKHILIKYETHNKFLISGHERCHAHIGGKLTKASLRKTNFKAVHFVYCHLKYLSFRFVVCTYKGLYI
jgi:hypothetical protein